MEKKVDTKKTNRLNKLTQTDVNVLLRAGSILIAAIIVSFTILYTTGSLNIKLPSSEKTSETDSECSGDSRLDDGCYEKYAEALNLDMNKFNSCVEEVTFDSVIDSELAYGKEIGVQGTPSMYVAKKSGEELKGFYVGGARYQDIDQLVDRLETASVEDVNAYWKDLLEKSLVGYEKELKAYFESEEGGSLKGAELEKAVTDTIAQQKQLIKTDYVLKDLEIGDGKVLGESDIVLMEFSDYECPYCQTFAKEVLTKVKTDFVDTGRAQYVFRDFPIENIHPKARPAANAARCAGDQGKYFEYHDKLFSI